MRCVRDRRQRLKISITDINALSVDQMLMEVGSTETDRRDEIISKSAKERAAKTAADMESFCDLHNLSPLDLLRVPPATLARHFSKFLNAPVHQQYLREAAISYLSEMYPTPIL